MLPLINPRKPFVTLNAPKIKYMKRTSISGMAENDTITMRLKIDSRGRIQIREEDRIFMGLNGGELLEVTIKRAVIPNH